ncbi:LuxR C-terminal-related transcriptional regulator [Streptacidiphilus rugosus]|uniref:LuxR C-terminal-related transcriptional regulator n=1 Tax=Streptacidiphilus rugosus TaxID=405783 RepID=UPI00055DD12E|nr:LuxR C-terminal-related transcriptional regulator [Streptacidiphilus rugosus]
MPDATRDQTRLLARFGLGADAEDVYMTLLTRTVADVAELAETTGFGLSRVGTALTPLMTNGLVLAVDQGNFRARAPESAFRDLLARRERDLDDDRTSVERLADVHRRSAAVRDAADIVQVISGRDALAAALRDLQESARHRVRSLVKAPVLALPAEDNIDVQLARMDEGVAYHTVYERSMLTDTSEFDLLGFSVRRGEEVRLANHLPVKMLLADSDQAVIPLDRGAQQEPVALVIRHRSLIEVLEALFERVWSAAAPLPAGRKTTGGSPEEAPEQHVGLDLSPSDRTLLRILVTGLPDRAVATHLGIGKRTVERRVRSLLDRAGVATRIELAVHATRQGWI